MSNYEILKEYEEHKEPIPSYIEWCQQKELEKADNYLINILMAQNDKLKKLLKECRERQVKIREALSLNMSKIAFDITFKIENEIDNALGEKK